MSSDLFKSILHNLGVVIVALALAFICTRLDRLLGIAGFRSIPATVVGMLLLCAGFLLRVWATLHFYQHRMSVISLEPQGALITTGPFGFSRNPLYLGGNVFMFFGAALLLGSPIALILTAVHLPFIDLFIRREERQLGKTFGATWTSYSKRVRRWI